MGISRNVLGRQILQPQACALRWQIYQILVLWPDLACFAWVMWLILFDSKTWYYVWVTQCNGWVVLFTQTSQVRRYRPKLWSSFDLSMCVCICIIYYTRPKLDKLDFLQSRPAHQNMPFLTFSMHVWQRMWQNFMHMNETCIESLPYPKISHMSEIQIFV